MKSKQLIILVAILAAAGIAAALKMRSRDAAIGGKPQEVGNRILKGFEPEGVAGFTISDGKDSVEVAFKDGKWVLPSRDGFPASLTAVNELRDAAHQLKVLSVQNVGASQLGRLQLREPASDVPEAERSKMVSFRDAGGKDTITFFAGKTSEPKSDGGMNFNAGPRPQFVRVKGTDGIVYQAVQGFASLNATVKSWLDKESFFKVEKLKSIAVTGPTPEESWKVFREAEGGELKLDAPKDGEEFDATKAAGPGGAFAYAAFEDLAPAADKEKAALDKPTHTAVIETFDGFTYTVKVGAKAAAAAAADAAAAENYYLSFSADGKFAEQRTPPAPDKDGKPTETEEQKKAADEAFAKDLQKKKEKLAAEQSHKDRIFVVTKYTLDGVLKKRAEFLKEKATPAAPGAVPGGVPGAAPAVPAVSVPEGQPGKIEAVTPPVSVEIPAAKPEEKKVEEVKPAVPAAEVKPAEVPAAEVKPAEAAPAAKP
jgi:hypothetical protein